MNGTVNYYENVRNQMFVTTLDVVSFKVFFCTFKIYKQDKTICNKYIKRQSRRGRSNALESINYYRYLYHHDFNIHVYT